MHHSNQLLNTSVALSRCFWICKCTVTLSSIPRHSSSSCHLCAARVLYSSRKHSEACCTCASCTRDSHLSLVSVPSKRSRVCLQRSRTS